MNHVLLNVQHLRADLPKKELLTTSTLRLMFMFITAHPPPLSSQNSNRDTTRSTPQPNPILLRLYKVLATNFNDDATKEALKTLSELYAPVLSTGSLKGKEIQRDTDEMDDEDAEDDALWGKASVTATNDIVPLESVPGESAAKARKNLRRDMENKLAAGSRQFLKAFGEVDQVGVVYTSCIV